MLQVQWIGLYIPTEKTPQNCSPIQCDEQIVSANAGPQRRKKRFQSSFFRKVDVDRFLPMGPGPSENQTLELQQAEC